MAKAQSTPSSKPEKKSSPKKKGSGSSDQLIEQACINALAKLNELDIEYQLQSEINWCLGSYRNDGNPIGLYQMAERSLAIFKEALGKKSKGVTAKFVTDLEKAIATAGKAS